MKQFNNHSEDGKQIKSELTPSLAYLYLHEEKEGHHLEEGIRHLIPRHQQDLKDHPYLDQYSYYLIAFAVFYFLHWQMVMPDFVVPA